MALLETLSIKLVGPAIKLLAEWILPESLDSESAVDGLSDFVDKRLKDYEERVKAKRLFEDLQYEVAKRLENVLEIEFGSLSESDREAAILTVGDALKSKGIAADVVRANLEPSRLYEILRTRSKTAIDSLDGSVALAAEFLLRETCVYVVRLADKLPDFRLEKARAILVRQDNLLDDMRKVLDAVIALTRQSETVQSRDVRNFEINYRRTLVRNLDRLQLFGVKQLNEIASEYPLSIAYVALRATATGVESSGSVESLFAGHNRLMIRGEAGTGKRL